MKLTRFLYRAARTTNDIDAVIHPKRPRRRVKKKRIGRLSDGPASGGGCGGGRWPACIAERRDLRIWRQAGLNGNQSTLPCWSTTSDVLSAGFRSLRVKHRRPSFTKAGSSAATKQGAGTPPGTSHNV
ncbi:MAG: hypothetical protein E6J20_00160 [Chloroflexi bacterium]|nr:MAG: hypothetical protein E6J20_00160 [Chloroflexota bacterium]